MKNKNNSAGKKPLPLRRGFYLGMSAALLLGACDPSYTYHSLTGTRSKEEISGMRRSPALNKRVPGSPAAASPQESALPPSAEITPYDQYDANGNEVSTAEASQQEEGGFFTRLFSSDDKQKTNPPAQHARKPLPGNPYSPLTSAAAPVVEAQVTDIETPQPAAADVAYAKETAATENPVESSDGNNTDAGIAANESAPAEKQEGLFDRIAAFFDGGSSQDEQQQADASQPVDEPAKKTEDHTVPDVKIVKDVPGYGSDEVASNADNESLLGSISSHFVSDSKENEEKGTYPKLSSVPASPPEFKSVKQEHQYNVNELKSDHGVALQDKESLDREVSGLPPEESALPDAQPELAMPAPLPAPADEGSSTAVDSLANAPEEKSIFSRFTFWDEPSTPAPSSSEAGTEEQASVKPQEEEKQAQPVFESAEKLFESPGQSQQEPSVREARVEEYPQVTPQVNFEDDAGRIQPLASISSPAGVEDTAPLQNDNAKLAGGPVFEPAENLLDNHSALPSPEIIKSMRPSRYEARRKQAHNSGY